MVATGQTVGGTKVEFRIMIARQFSERINRIMERTGLTRTEVGILLLQIALDTTNDLALTPAKGEMNGPT